MYYTNVLNLLLFLSLLDTTNVTNTYSKMGNCSISGKKDHIIVWNHQLLYRDFVWRNQNNVFEWISYAIHKEKISYNDRGKPTLQPTMLTMSLGAIYLNFLRNKIFLLIKPTIYRTI